MGDVPNPDLRNPELSLHKTNISENTIQYVDLSLVIMIYNPALVWIPMMFMTKYIKAEPSHRSLRYLMTNTSTATMELIEPAPPPPVPSTLSCWMDPNNLKYVCLSEVDEKSGHVSEKCSDKSSQLLAVRCWCTLTVQTNAASSSEQFMHHCVSCSSSNEGSNANSTTKQQKSNETRYDCRHIRTDGFISHAYNGTIPSNKIDENDSLYFDAASETSGDTKSSRQQAGVTVYEDTIVIEPLQDVVILTVENTTIAESDVILEQGTTTGGTVVSKGGSKQTRPPKLHKR